MRGGDARRPPLRIAQGSHCHGLRHPPPNPARAKNCMEIFFHMEEYFHFLLRFLDERKEMKCRQRKEFFGEKKPKVQILQRVEGAESAQNVSDCTKWHTICII